MSGGWLSGWFPRGYRARLVTRFGRVPGMFWPRRRTILQVMVPVISPDYPFSMWDGEWADLRELTGIWDAPERLKGDR